MWGWAVALLLAATPAAAQIKAGDAVTPPSTEGYQPQGTDERGLWLELDEYERDFRTSAFVVRDPALNAYVKGVLCRTVGERCRAARLYLVRTADFNATMAPNGMMQVWTGLLLRVRNEAQLAAVLGHEFTHFEARHSLRNFRDLRAKTDAMAWLSFVPFGVGMAAQVGLAGGFFANSRAQEAEADLGGLRYLATAGYAPGEAAKIWEGLRAEQDATAAARRRKSKKDKNGGFFATHPNSAERVAYLTKAAGELPGPSNSGDAAYRTALAPWWPALVDDQIKLNDFGGTEYLLATLAASGGWTPELLYARGELYRARGLGSDLAAAIGFYREALAAGSALPELRRGLGLALLRSGAAGEGRALLRDYARLKPDAGDRAMMLALAEER